MKRTISILVIALALVAAACGGGDAEPEQTSVTVGALPLVDFAPLFWADQQGYFTEEGLDVTVEVVQGGPIAAQLLLAGDIQFSFNNWLSVVGAVANGAPLTVVANATWLGDGQGGVFVLPDSPIQTLADLDGRTVSTNTIGNVGDIAIENLIAEQGLDIEIQYVEVSFPESIPAVQSGAVDAAFLTEPFTSFALASGLRSVADPYTGRVANLPIAGYVSTQEFANANPGTVAAFRRAIERATEELAADEELLRGFIPQYSQVPAEVAASLALPIYQTDLTVEDLQVPADLMADLGFLDEPLDASEFVFNP